jgi:hypothetical protein
MTEKTRGKAQEARLEELSMLRVGWLNGEGEAISEMAVEHARQLLSALEPDGDNFRIYPMPDGGIQLENNVPTYNLSVEVRSGDYSIHVLKISTNEVEEFGTTNVHEVVSFIRRYLA